jgi:hypothetical protein
MERRDLLRAFGAATALTLLPHRTLEAWTRVASGVRRANGLSDAHMALVRAIADTIIPRTDTPSATDVGVPDFVDVIVTEQASDDERAKALAGLDALEAKAVSTHGASFTALGADARGTFIDEIEKGPRDQEPSRTYWRLKGLIVHGYFTSEAVMKNVLKHNVLPGRFEGSAPVALKRAKPAPGSAADAHGGLHG